MKVTYIAHSGFMLEMDDVDFLFDYYKGEVPLRDPQKPFFVFVSHRHQDHYNPEIFELIRQYPKVKFVISRDVPVKREIQTYQEKGIDLQDFLNEVKKNTVYSVELKDGQELKIETFKSTDEGVAFLLECNGKTIYHAGDLNLWIWEGETDQYNQNMTKAYFAQLDKLKGRTIDVAFVPLDPRQEKDAFGGMESFLEYTQTDHIFPMHFWNDYGIIGAFKEAHPEYAEKIFGIEREGQEFTL